jgi:hypothetical protein
MTRKLISGWEEVDYWGVLLSGDDAD